MDKKHFISAFAGVVVGVLLVLGVSYLTPNTELGATVGGAELFKLKANFQNGLQVAGTDTITSARALSVEAGTFGEDIVVDDDNTTSTISVGSSGVGKLCLYNGSNFTILSYADDSVTLTTVTSTACE